MQGQAAEARAGEEHVAPACEGHADVVRVDGELVRDEIAEKRGRGPGEVDALEDDVLERGKIAGEDDDRGRADGSEETFGGAPVLDVPELESLEEGGAATGVEDLAGETLALEVCDLEMVLMTSREDIAGGV